MISFSLDLEQDVGQLEHADIDVSESSTEALSEEEWNDLTQQYYLLVQ